ncbi:hypothetical protein AnigIFM59636_005426 [Aspergillus niger]|nr:hypothetical protein AnigIFM59636_005426 [Aspergillus niger]
MTTHGRNSSQSTQPAWIFRPDYGLVRACKPKALAKQVEYCWTAFCLQHFVRVHAREFPFLHSSSWRTSWELSGKALAMAAIGGCRIPSYGGHSRLYFDLAVHQVKSFTASLDGAEYQDAPGTATWNDAYYRRLLTSFETYILLIRYSVWSEFADLREWGIKSLADHAITVMPRLARVMSDNSHNSTSWLLWLLLEESKRALWCFYCLAVKCRHFLHYSISTFEVVVGNIHLPCPDSLFEAPDEQTWTGLNNSNAPQHLIGLTVPSQIAFYYLMSQEPMPQLTPNKVGTYTSHILLCNLLNTYETGRTSSWNFTSLDAYLDSDISCFRLRTELIRALDYWKWLFWRDPHELWHSRHPDHQINSMMLCVYLEAQMWSSSKPHLLSASRRRAGAQLAFDLLSLISRTGFLVVGAKSPFYVEPVVYFCTRSLGQAMLAWYDSLGDVERTIGRATDDADWMLYDKILECLNRLPGTLDGFSLPPVQGGPSSPTPLSPLSFTNSLRDAIVRDSIRTPCAIYALTNPSSWQLRRACQGNTAINNYNNIGENSIP